MNALSHYSQLPDNAVLSLIAPTASGKTDFACRLYDTGRFEIISVDSALIYRDMNIGTAKPSTDELNRYPHHLVDIISPEQTYNVATFAQDVQTLIAQIHERGKLPLLVGGTMMYYLALFEGLSPVPDSDPVVRQKVMQWLDDEGIEAVYAYLQSVDAPICQRLKISDTQRITRAVEVHLQTGTPMSDWQSLPKQNLWQHTDQQWIGINLSPDRAWLHQRIELRLEMMWRAGLLSEVVGLLQDYRLEPDMPSMRCVGYRQVLEWLATINHPVMQSTPALSRYCQKVQNDLSDDERTFFMMHRHECEQIITNPIFFDQMCQNLQKHGANPLQMACQVMKNKALYATRQLAKRQYTWQRSLVDLNDASTTNKDNSTQSASFSMLSFASIQEVEKQLLKIQ